MTFVTLILTGLVSCQKECLDDSIHRYAFSGHWKNYRNATDYRYLNIDGADGYIAEFVNGSLQTTFQNKHWMISDEYLYYGSFSGEKRKFHIDSFPQIANQNFTVLYNQVDSGNFYMWLDGVIYENE